MNIKSIIAIAAGLAVAGTAFAQDKKDASCGKGSCSKAEKKDGSCSKKDGSCSKKDSSCSKKDGSCSKKEHKEEHKK
ncbi:MAG: hypothetical protein QM520_02920 [Gammaproteobacteria bacterium]|nr:hypothetical protein [Gammaproteobacteria bacterium]